MTNPTAITGADSGMFSGNVKPFSFSASQLSTPRMNTPPMSQDVPFYLHSTVCPGARAEMGTGDLAGFFSEWQVLCSEPGWNHCGRKMEVNKRLARLESHAPHWIPFHNPVVAFVTSSSPTTTSGPKNGAKICVAPRQVTHLFRTAGI